MSMPLAGSDYRSTTTKYMSPISASRSAPAVYAKHAGDRSGGERYLAFEEATQREVRFDAASPAEPAADRTVALAPAGGEEIEASGRTACSSAAGSDSRANKRSRRGRWLGLHREIALRVAGYAPQLLQLKAAVH